MTNLFKRTVLSLQAMTKKYCNLAGSGDAGFWNPEEEPEVIEARKVLADIEKATPMIDDLQARIARVLELDKKLRQAREQHDKDTRFPGDLSAVKWAQDNLRDEAPEMASIIRELVGICEIAHEALDELVYLKRHKDKEGKTLHYQEQKPLAWEKANGALALLSPVLKRRGDAT
jgi:hypothetical protein